MWKSVVAVFPTIPPGTLAANIIGGYIIGVAVGLFAISSVPPEWRLFVITGFCGGLTTFSTFSAEVTSLLQQGRLAWACAEIATHVVSSVSMTFLGIATTSLFRAHE
jgi:CrcB protein